MRKFLLVSVVSLIVGSMLIQFIKQDAGYILVSIHNYTFETSFWVGCLTFTLFLTAVIALLYLFLKFLHSIAVSLNWFSESREKINARKTQAGLLHFIEGNWNLAKKELVGAAKNSDKPVVHYLAAANSAHALGLNDEANFLLDQAEKSSSVSDSSVLINRAKVKVADQKFKEALATLKCVSNKQVNSSAYLNLLKECFIGLNDWPALIELAPKLKKHTPLSSAEYEQLLENTYLSLLYAQKSEGVEQSWSLVPKAYKKNVRLVGGYAKLLQQQGKYSEAVEILMSSIEKNWNLSLLELLTHFPQKELQSCLSQLEKLEKKHTDTMLSYLLGQASAANQLWGQAKSYFQASLKQQESAKTYASLGDLYAQMGEADLSCEAYRQGLITSLN